MTTSPLLSSPVTYALALLLPRLLTREICKELPLPAGGVPEGAGGAELDAGGVELVTTDVVVTGDALLAVDNDAVVLGSGVVAGVVEEVGGGAGAAEVDVVDEVGAGAGVDCGVVGTAAVVEAIVEVVGGGAGGGTTLVELGVVDEAGLVLNTTDENVEKVLDRVCVVVIAEADEIVGAALDVVSADVDVANTVEVIAADVVSVV